MDVTENLTDLILMAKYLISKGALTPKAGGIIYDMLYYHLFQNRRISFAINFVS
jgi:hypothetical protein